MRVRVRAVGASLYGLRLVGSTRRLTLELVSLIRIYFLHGKGTRDSRNLELCVFPLHTCHEENKFAECFAPI